MRLKHLRAYFFFSLMNLPLRRQWRYLFVKMGVVRLLGNHYFIGRNVTFDTVFPENITIDNQVHITDNCVFLTHYLDTSKSGVHWTSGNIHIGEKTFIGTGTIIAKSCKIGKNVIIGAGSVVTKDIPDNEVWAGNPAHFIKRRDINKCN